jgi:chemotaxis-related protein WspD
MTGESNKLRPECWKLIGSSGDGSCSELQSHGHCRNCPDYAAAGRILFDRTIPLGYQAQWTQIIASEKESEKADLISVIIFRIKSEWLALKTSCFQEITSERSIHSVPHRTDEFFKGLVNVGGELLLCISMADILGVNEEPADDSGTAACRRMAVIKAAGRRFVFTVDEILGVQRIARNEIQTAPATISKSATAFTGGIFDLDDRRVGLLQEQPLFDSIHSRLRSFS